MRILLGPYEVAGYYEGLRRGFRALGVESVFVNLAPHAFAYGSTPANRLVAWTQAVIGRRQAAAGASAVRRLAWLAVEAAARGAVLLWALARFDVFVLGFGCTFLNRPRFEFPLFRLLRKRVVVVFHGSDSRPPYLDGFFLPPGGPGMPRELASRAREVKARVRRIDRYADAVVQNPFTAHFHERPCINFLRLGIPVAPRSAMGGERAGCDAVRILHSPSHPEGKGTARIREAVRRIKARGHAVELVEVTGRPNAEVLQELARCDFVVDQVYSDTPMAGFATEAAHFAKPAVVGGYASDEVDDWFAAGERPPTEFCHPDDIEAAIERLVVDRQYRLALGRRVHAFVHTEWTPEVVARRFLEVIRGSAPSGWSFDPGRVRYVHGAGMPASRARAVLARMLEGGGPAVLQVEDKPVLERRLVEFAGARAPAEAGADRRLRERGKAHGC